MSIENADEVSHLVVLPVACLDQSNQELVNKALAAGHAVMLVPSKHESKIPSYAVALNAMVTTFESNG